MQIDFEGTTHEFPDDFTDQEISAALRSSAKNPIDRLPEGAAPFRGAVGGVETMANMVSALPGMAVGGLSAGTYGLRALPNMVGLPGIGGADMSKVGDVYQGVAKDVNKYTQYEPRTHMGKVMSEGIGKGIEWAIEKAGEGGEAVGGNAGRAIATAGAGAVAELGPGLGLVRFGKSIKPGDAAKRPDVAVDRAKQLLKSDEPVPEAPLPQLLPEYAKELEGVPPGYPEVPVGAPDGLPRPNLMVPPEVPPVVEQKLPKKLGDAKVSTLPKPNERVLTEAEQQAKTMEQERSDAQFAKVEEAIRSQVEPEVVPGQGVELGGPRFGIDTPRETALDNVGQAMADQYDPRFSASKQVGDSLVDLQKTTPILAEANGFVDLKKTFQVLLDNVRQATAFPFMNPYIKQLQKSLGDVKVRVVKDLGEKSGYYDFINNEVVLSGKSGMNNYVLLHELTHAAVDRWLYTHGFKDGKFQRIGDNPVYNKIAELAIKASKELGTDHYAFKDIKEFVAEARSNDKFRKMLASIPGDTPKKSLWDNLKEQIYKIFGANTPKQKTLLDEVMHWSDKAIAEQAADKKGYAEKAGAVTGVESKLSYNEVKRPDFPFEKVQTAIKASTSEVAGPEARLNLMAKVPGMEEGLKDYIAPDVAPEAAIAELKTKPDIKKGWSLIGGKEMAAAIKDSPVLYTVGQWFNHARARATLLQEELVNPVAQSVNKLLQSGEGETVLGVFKEEMFSKKKLSPEQLDEIGLTAKQKESYLALRQAYDDVYAKVNEARMELGMDAIPYHEAYISSRWGGDWRTPILDKNGKVVWYIAETSKARAQSALAFMKEKFPDLDYAKSEITYNDARFTQESSALKATYTDMVEILGKDDPLVQKLKEAYEQQVQNEAYGTLGVSKHFEPKAGVRGFVGDQPWKNSKEDARLFFKEQMNYLRNSLQWAESQKAVSQVKKVLTDQELQSTHKNTLEWVKEMSRNELGYGTTKGWAKLEKSASEMLGTALADSPLKYIPGMKNVPTDLASINTGIGVTKSLFYIKNLGVFNLPFAFMSLVQPVFTIPHHARLALDGYHQNPLKTSYQSWQASLATILHHYHEATGIPSPMKHLESLPPLFQEAAKYLDANKVAEMSQLSEVRDLGRSEGLQSAEKVLGITITEPEFMARTKTFMEYVSALDQSGKFDSNMKIFEKAEELTKLTMGNYAQAERAALFNRLGETGSALSTLKTYPINQINQLYNFYKYGKRGDSMLHYTPFVAMMGIQLSLAGAMGFYGMGTADDLWNLYKKAYLEMGGKNKQIAEFSPKRFIIANSDNLVSYGGVSQLTNMNFSSRMDAGTIVDPSMSGLLPFVSDAANIASSSAKFLLNPNQETFDRAVYAAAPASLKGFAEMRLPTLSGENKETMRPSNPSEILSSRSEWDKTTRGAPFWGVPSLKEGMTKEADFRNNATEASISQAKRNAVSSFERAIREGDPEEIRDKLLAYVDEWGDPRPLMRGLKADQLKLLLTKGQRLGMRAKTPAAIQKYQRYQEVMQNVPTDN
jgi:hypothetical protein